jgi:hypothetical protein
MAWNYKVKIGNGMIEIEGKDFKEVWAKAGFLNDVPRKCSLCGSEDVAPMYKTPKGYEYYGMKCRSCGAEQTFHSKKDDGSPFIKWDDKFEKYDGSKSQEAKPPQNDGPEDFQSDILF